MLLIVATRGAQLDWNNFIEWMLYVAKLQSKMFYIIPIKQQ